jgi:hypothetical protein
MHCMNLLKPSGFFTYHQVSLRITRFNIQKYYRVRQKYLTILQNSCEPSRWCGKFALERSSSETQSISVAMERWSVDHRAFAVETYFKNNDSVLNQRIFGRHFNIHRNECP